LRNFEFAADPAALFAEHREWAARHADPLSAAAAPHTNDRSPDRRLRIGYVSGHFRHHAVAFFSEPLLAAHDREQFEVFCYAHQNQEDSATQRFRARADGWCDLFRMSDHDAAARIRDDRIDILIDLAGHIGDNRLLIFAHRPAPVQVTYLGYQNTTGMRAMDYRLTDAHADPPGTNDAYYTEQLVRLPGAFFCYARPEEAPPVGAPPFESQGHVTFASLNNLNKLNDEALQAWARILARVPGSRLLVLGYSQGVFERRVRQKLSDEGIDGARVDVVNKRPRAEYLAVHHQIDIALDSFPFNGHTTVCDALWMGVPSVMLEGTSYATRFGGRTLLDTGLGDLIARNVDDYVSLAVQLANDRARLAELRRSTRQRLAGSRLMDAQAFARDVEAAYRRMWHDWCAAPAPSN
jgi:predicted O-linked N-acetylglucosamine transferase (SPINDLY family)